METKQVILTLRTKTGLSQDELAEKLFVTRQAVSRWENGDTVPNTETLKLLSRLFDVSINTLLGSPRQLVCQCCGMPLESDDMLGRDSDGTPNEDYCKWCYADGTYAYHDMDDLIRVCVPHMTGEGFTEEQARTYLKERLPQLDYWKRHGELSDNGQFEAFKAQLIREINALHIEGMPPLEHLTLLSENTSTSPIRSRAAGLPPFWTIIRPTSAISSRAKPMKTAASACSPERIFSSCPPTARTAPTPN